MSILSDFSWIFLYKQKHILYKNNSPFNPASTYIPTLAKCSIISEEELNC